MKRFLQIFLVCLLTLALLTACGDKTPSTPPWTTPPYTPTGTAPTDPATPTDPLPTDPAPTEPVDPNHTCQAASEDYSMDINNHWFVCECGKAVNVEAHRMEEDFCRICSAEIYVDHYENITYLCLYNEYGDDILCQHYDDKGNLLMIETYAYSYNDQGYRMAQKRYVDGNLVSEITWDVWGNALSITEYDDTGDVIFNEIYELTCDIHGNILSEKRITNGVLSYEGTFGLSDEGYTYLIEETYYLEDGTKEHFQYNPQGDVTTEIYYDTDGNAVDTYTYQYTYEDVLITSIHCNHNGKLLYTEQYTVVHEGDWSYNYLNQRTDYQADGGYTITIFDEEYNIVSEECFDANGNPVDFSSNFNSQVCAPLFGTWNGTFNMDGLYTNITITFRADGTMLAIMEMEEEAYREYMIQFTTELILAMYGEDMTIEELDAYFRAECGMSLKEYVLDMVNNMDFSEALYQEFAGVYYVDGTLLYAGNSWNSFMDSCAFTLDGNQLTLESEDLGDALVLTKQVAAANPIDPPKDLQAHPKFDATTCAPMFGAWEYSQIMSTKEDGYDFDQHLTVVLTIRITFTENGIQVMQMIADEEAYFEYMVVTQVEETYLKAVANGMTREQLDAEYASRGTTVREEVEEGMRGRNLLPSDGYFCYYVENGCLFYGTNAQAYMNEFKLTVNGNTMVMYHEASGEEIILTKVL